jgi:hypothetical protein
MTSVLSGMARVMVALADHGERGSQQISSRRATGARAK